MDFPELLVAGLILLLLFITGFAGAKFKIPNIIMFILVGIIIGGLFTDTHLLHFAGEIGIVLLFFMLGMEFPVKQLLSVAKKVLRAGVLDVILSFGVTAGICLLMGLDVLSSLIIGGVVYATSSSITAKMLESSKRMANPESEFMLGLLIFEDLVAPILVAVLVGVTAGTAVTTGSMGLLVLKVLILVAGAIILGRFVFSKAGGFFDKYMNEDIFLLFVIGLALVYGGLALYLDLSEVLGAFLAGIMLAEVRRTHELEHLVVRSRDLLLPLFFLYFGTTINFSDGVPMISLLLEILAWSVAAKIIVGYFGGQWYGLSKRISLRAGLSLTQRGEFSIIIAALAAGTIQAFSSIFIILSAVLGILLFQFAPAISIRIFGRKKLREQRALAR
ncbi:cation:proton antiporter [Evansella clarkii]|uniref:cation:proton antiporter n=1 Tax=Evansella clarkii TaxID=79879 RepID=UPI00099751CC|nr:cation:proton antiporter [Evansella clarkii]